jgi:hypothetical protein
MRNQRGGAEDTAVPWWQFKRGLPRRGVKDEAQAPINTAELSSSQRKRLNRRRYEIFRFAGAPKTVSTKYLAVLEWSPAHHMALVRQPRGKIFQSLGIVRGPEHWLYPEEAVFLVDRSSADLLVDGIATSVERCFALLLYERIPLEHYYAYAYLRRLGYHVRRSLSDIRAAAIVGAPFASAFQGDRVPFHYDVWPPGNFKRSMPGVPLFRAVVLPFSAPVWTAAQMRHLAEAAEPSSARIIVVERSIVAFFEVRAQGPLAKPANPADLWMAERALALQSLTNGPEADASVALGAFAAEDDDDDDDDDADAMSAQSSDWNASISGSDAEECSGVNSHSASSSSSNDEQGL